MPVPDSVKAAIQSLDAAAKQEGISESVRSKKMTVIQGKALHDHLRASLVQGRTVELGEYKISIERVGLDPVTGLVELFGVSVWKNNKKVALDSHLQFLNAPIMVPDSGGDIEFTVRGDNGKPKKMKARVDPAAVILLDILAMVGAS